ncbi:hypothetical protein PG990_001527 [Apiospora arundinis]
MGADLSTQKSTEVQQRTTTTMPPQNTSDSEGDGPPAADQHSNGSEDTGDDVPHITTDLHGSSDDDHDDENGRHAKKPTRKLARFSDAVEVIQAGNETKDSFKGRVAAVVRGGRRGRGSRADTSKSSIVALGDAEDDDVDSDDSDTYQVNDIMSRLDKKANERRQSLQNGKRPAVEVSEEDDEDDAPKSAKKRGRPAKSPKKQEAAQVNSESSLPGPRRGRSIMRTARNDSTTKSSLGQINNPASSPLKRKKTHEAGAGVSPRRSARAAVLADKAAKAKAADDKKAKEIRDATPAPKRRRSTGKKQGNKKKDENQKGSDKNGVYTVEKIVDHAIDKKTGGSIFKVKWKNYPESQNTWEPKSNLDGCTKKLQEYLATLD